MKRMVHCKDCQGRKNWLHRSGTLFDCKTCEGMGIVPFEEEISTQVEFGVIDEVQNQCIAPEI